MSTRMESVPVRFGPGRDARADSIFDTQAPATFDHAVA